ncbi:MAG: hypothetical protein RRY29_03705 [Desulfovibrionaceae bacterium]
MIAESLQQSVNRLRAMLIRDNGDLTHGAPTMLNDLEADIERVRGLEAVACVEIPVHLRPCYPHTEAINGRA